MKFHRPRGWFCGVGKCSSCLMRVNGVPNVPVCVTPLAAGDSVESQNAFPSTRFDLFRANDLLFRKDVDYHEAFIRPRFAQPLYFAVMRQFAGFGSLPDRPAPPSGPARFDAADLLVAGGGGAGLAAAREAASRGVATLLVDDGDVPGGSLRLLTGRLPGISALGAGTRGFRLAERLAREAAEAGARFLTSSSLLGVYGDGSLPVLTRQGLVDVSAPAVVAANGHQERSLVAPGNDLPGLMGPRGALALCVAGVPPGERAVIVGAGWDGLETARELAAWGVEIAAVVDPSEHLPGPRVMAASLLRQGIPVLLSSRVEKVHGFSRVTGVTLSGPEGSRRIACDLVVACGRKASPELCQQAGATLATRDDGNLVPDSASDGSVIEGRLWAAGEAKGVPSGLAAVVSGRVAGRSAAAHLGKDGSPDSLAGLVEEADLLAAGHLGSGKPLAIADDELQAPPDARLLAAGSKAIVECPDRYVCDVCSSNCPKGAIEMATPADPPRVNYDLCDGCGGCVSLCPTAAIQLVHLVKGPRGAPLHTYTFPHDAWWTPKEGTAVTLLDRSGRPLGPGLVTGFAAWKDDAAGLVTITADVPDARGWRLPSGAAGAPAGRGLPPRGGAT